MMHFDRNQSRLDSDTEVFVMELKFRVMCFLDDETGLEDMSFLILNMRQYSLLAISVIELEFSLN